jgi:hypothetical protein
MSEDNLLRHLEDLTHRLGVELRYENLALSRFRTEGGYCVLAGKPLILINRNDSRQKKIKILLRSLSKMDLNNIFVPPIVRKKIENLPN